ncbi:MAG: 50S ribosomal protein L13 [Epsilonproteobacteria bacterium]|nr:50S ribosomal protein L13 [Campylobacterota bacterium]
MKFTKSITSKDVKRDWILIDAKGKTFGRVLTEAAKYLMGKHKPYYTPNVDCGDYVVIINAKEVTFSGNKLEDKEYFRHSGYFGSTKSTKLKDMLENHTEKLFRLAVRGMLPKTKLGRAMLKKLKVYPDENHPHTAQIGKGK